MRALAAPLSLLFLLAMYVQYPGAPERSPNTAGEEAGLIKQVVSEAVSYHGWINEPDYQSRLAGLFAGDLLDRITAGVEEFRAGSTDWHYLTFMRRCHIVYNNGNRALVVAQMEEKDPWDALTGQGEGTFTLHKTDSGWRIIEMEIIWKQASP